MTDNEDPYLNLDEVRRLLGISIETVYRWRKHTPFGKLNFSYIKGKKSLYVQKSEVLKYMADHVESKLSANLNDQISERFLSRQELAKRLRINSSTLANWNCSCKHLKYTVPIVKLVNASPKYRVEDVEAWLAGLFCNYSRFEEFNPHIDIMDEKLLLGKEVCEILGISQTVLFNWYYHKRYFLPFIKIGKINRYRASDVQRCKEVRDAKRLKNG